MSTNNNNNSGNSNSNSNSNSKRSFHSLSSTKKTTSTKKQKTLGAAWGSNSRSSSSFRSSPFSDFGSYMAVKNKKLHEQFDAAAAEASTSSHSNNNDTNASKKPPLFHGVSIFVDGFTIPSSQELRGFMLKHGGKFENYFSRRRVTHIICSNLPDSKVKNLRSFSRGLPVVKPTWISDCVAANKLLSWIPYQLDQLVNDGRTQPKLSQFFSSKTKKIGQATVTDSAYLLQNDVEDLESKDTHLNDVTSCNSVELPECSRSSEKEGQHIDCKQTVSEGSLEQTYAIEQSSKLEVENSVSAKKCDPSSPSTSASSLGIHNKTTGGPSSSVVGGPSSHRHSTSEDPNFVENYFKSSRLHFIGTWRNRYRKRFANLSSNIKQSNFNLSGSFQKSTIIHIDMDCFFVAVVIRNRPELLDKPVAVCHSDSSKGTAEISSANYPARDYGVKAGMFVRDAKARCPHLVIVPYNFEAYEEVADQFYSTLHLHCNKVQAVSCDEAFLDVTDSDEKDPELLASVIRKEIFEATGCTASAGIGGNVLIARLATSSAKPNGQCFIPSDKVDEHLVQLPVKALPGIGRVLDEKLKKKGITTCGQLRMLSKESLQRDFGFKTGEMLWNHSRGVDNRRVGVIQETKSVGAEVNWGVRFKDMKDTQHFLLSLCKEVSLRLQGCGVVGRTFTLKLKKRREDAAEPTKYMGCGDCENMSHSTTIPVATDDPDVLQRITLQLFGFFHTDVTEIRGIGLQVTKLESADASKQGHERNTLRSWLSSGGVNATNLSSPPDTGQSSLDPVQSSSALSASSVRETSSNMGTALPSLEDLDMDVLESLPPELFSEINEMYGGKLSVLLSKGKGKEETQMTRATSPRRVEGHASAAGPIRNFQENDEAGCSRDWKIQSIPAPEAVKTAVNESVAFSDNVDLMPSSLSQVDTSVLLQLPEELRADILGALPSHRSTDCPPGSGTFAMEGLQARVLGDNGFKESSEEKQFWVGNPPSWVLKFKVSNCLMLNILSEMYVRSGSSGLFSSTLQCCLSGFQRFSDVSEEVADEASNNLCELLSQYIQLKLEFDIEEIFVCFRLLKRLSMKSKAFLHIFDAILPRLQASVSEFYGGSLDLSSIP